MHGYLQLLCSPSEMTLLSLHIDLPRPLLQFALCPSPKPSQVPGASYLGLKAFTTEYISSGLVIYDFYYTEVQSSHTYYVEFLAWKHDES